MSCGVWWCLAERIATGEWVFNVSAGVNDEPLPAADTVLKRYVPALRARPPTADERDEDTLMRRMG
jgi:hypothetical protein